MGQCGEASAFGVGEAQPAAMAIRTWKIITAPRVEGREAIVRVSIHPT
jgi:hypothetical protein